MGRTRGVIVAALCALALPATASADFLSDQAAIYGKINERAVEFGAPAYRSMQLDVGLAEESSLLAALAADPERNPLGNVCAHRLDFCQGDARLYGWEDNGYGRSAPVLWTDASGATISAHVWATRAGPPKRPLIVISNGSLQAPETVYWWAATTLAKAGYVVITFDPQGQGQSDTFGEGEDALTHVPAEAGYLSPVTSSYLDGTRDAITFGLSRPKRPYMPPPSKVTGVSHAAKQERRVAASLNQPFNPFWKLVDRKRIGLAGHSTGTGVVMQISNEDPRIDAVVLWDSVDYGTDGQVVSYPPPATPRKPMLTLWADYGIPPLPYGAPPDPAARLGIFDAYRRAGIDTMSVAIRGGSHAEFSYIPSPAFGATLRGMDLASWYTTAWFDRYVKDRRRAKGRLLTDRWLDDARGAAADSLGNGNLISTYYDSGVAIRPKGGGRRIQCRWNGAAPCARLRPDRVPGEYSYLGRALSAD